MDIETVINNITVLQDRLERIVSALRKYQVEHNTAKSANSISAASYNLDSSDNLGRKLQNENKVEQ